jgi:hypothetical protein
MSVRDCALVAALRAPHAAAAWPLAEWDRLIRQARRADLLPRLAWALREAGAWQVVPEVARFHLESAEPLAEKQQLALNWELAEIARALEDLPGPVILLKGAAYFAAGLPPHHGRLFGDIDLLVPRPQLEAAEAALMLAGWQAEHHTAYDQRYYRQWMHEIPPMQHVRRLSVIDLHHAILPTTARIKTDPAALFAAARSLPGTPLRVLCPADMVLHSATHLFHEGEFTHGLRDLVDLDALLRHFGTVDFWETLAARADELNLRRPLFYALRYCRRVMGTPIPDSLAASGRPWLPGLLDAMFERGLAPDHDSCDDRLTGIARGMLYVRGHWLRMPLRLLLPHLFHKAFLAEREEAAREKEQAVEKFR